MKIQILGNRMFPKCKTNSLKNAGSRGKRNLVLDYET